MSAEAALARSEVAVADFCLANAVRGRAALDAGRFGRLSGVVTSSGKKRTLWLLVILVVGLAGYFFPARRAGAPLEKPARAASPSGAKLIVVKEKPPLSPPRDESVPAATTEPPVVVGELSKPVRRRVLFTPFLVRMTPTFREDYGLTPAETNALNQAAEAARKRIGDLALANATVRTDATGTVTIEVRAFAEGGVVYDELLRNFATVLGPERYAVFLPDAAESLERAMGYLGVAMQTIELRHDPAAAGRAEYYWVRMKTKNDRVDLSGASLAAARAYLGPLMQLLPADF